MTAVRHAHAAVRVPPTFTVGSALSWLGHRCPHRCSAAVEDLAASISFTPLGNTLRPAPQGTVVVVELGAAAPSSHELGVLIGAVRACAAQDGIAVCTTRAPDDTTRLAPRSTDLNAHHHAVPACAAGVTDLSDNRGGNPVADHLAVGGADRPGGGPHLPRCIRGRSTAASQTDQLGDPAVCSGSRSTDHAASTFGITEVRPDKLALVGEFDLNGLELWNGCAARSLERHYGDVHINLAGLRFIDAAGMGAVISLANTLAEHRHQLTLQAPTRAVRRAFTAAGLTHLMPR